MRLSRQILILTIALLLALQIGVIAQTSPSLNNTVPQILVSKPTPAISSRNADDITTKPAAVAAIPINKDLVVVSKTPEFFTYTLSTISVLLTALTILIGGVTGVGAAIVLKVEKERKALERARHLIEQEKTTFLKDMKRDYDKMVEALKKTSFKLSKMHNAKKRLRDLLASDVTSSKEIYKELQRTVAYPDEECLRLYSRVLEKYEDRVDLVRLVRNGLMHYSRNPE